MGWSFSDTASPPAPAPSPSPRPTLPHLCRNGMGRHTFVFMRRINIYSSAAFQVFVALPFVYELRQLLDWSCTPTTLT